MSIGFLQIDDDIIDVSLFKDACDTKLLKNGSGYIIDDHVYIFHKKKEYDETTSGIYLVDDQYVVVEYDKKEAKKFHKDNVIILDSESIRNSLIQNKDDYLESEDEMEFLKGNSTIYSSAINEDDDFLKAVLKTAINLKKIDLKEYKDKFPTPYMLNNMKSSLKKDTKMSADSFNRWCGPLGLSWKIIIGDDGTDTKNPLRFEIEFSSDNPEITIKDLSL